MSDLADVVIVGGGILGLSLAYEFAQCKLRVILLEAQTLASKATGNTFGWIEGMLKTEDEAYHHLNVQGIHKYNALAAEWGTEALGLHCSGALKWIEPGDPEVFEKLRQDATQLQAWGYPIELLDRMQMQELEPQVSFLEGSVGLYAPIDQWLDARHFARFLASSVREFGGKILEDCAVTGFKKDTTGRVTTVETVQGSIGTHLLILAAGVQTPALVSKVTGAPTDSRGFPLQRRAGLLIETPPGSAPGLVQRVLDTPGEGRLSFRPTPEGGLLLIADGADATLIGETSDDIPKNAPLALLERAARFLPALPVAALKEKLTARVGVRPIPKDGLPIAGPLSGLPGVYVAVMHYGITLGPLIAQLLTEEIVTGQDSALLAPYRLDRFHG